ncbi:MAG: thiamine pyrophosphate-binding protein [Phycisphaeraceae bacterium]|nr:thiamine pyrophosphate-binding protein [Phycisphaeraceae bacterium]
MVETNTTIHTGATALVSALAAQGIDRIFGVPGGHSVPIFDALSQQEAVRLVLGRHEQGLVFMADGYSRASGRIGVVTTTSGPGVANMAAAMGQATTDTSAVLAVSTTVATTLVRQNRGALHDLNDSLEIMKPVCRAVRRCERADEIPHVIAELVGQLRNGRPGGVYCEIPHDLLSASVPATDPPTVAVAPEPPESACVETAGQWLGGAQQPLLWAGTGTVISGAGDVLAQLAERLGAVVVTSALARGVLPAQHPNLIMRNPLAGGPVDELIADADVVLAVGTMFKQEDASLWNIKFDGKLIHVDIDEEEIGRTYEPDLGIVADARVALEAIVAALPDRAPADTAWLDRANNAQRELFGQIRQLAPAETQAVEVLRHALPEGTIVVADRCSLGYWAHRCLPANRPRCFQYPMGYGGLGGALPQAIGAKIACPDQPVVCIIGDGGFQYTGTELIMAVQEQTPITIVVCNNRSYGAIEAGMQLNLGRAELGCNLLNPDFQKFADAYGVAACRTDTLDAFAAALTTSVLLDAINLIELTVELRDPQYPERELMTKFS